MSSGSRGDRGDKWSSHQWAQWRQNQKKDKDAKANKDQLQKTKDELAAANEKLARANASLESLEPELQRKNDALEKAIVDIAALKKDNESLDGQVKALKTQNEQQAKELAVLAAAQAALETAKMELHAQVQYGMRLSVQVKGLEAKGKALESQLKEKRTRVNELSVLLEKEQQDKANQKVAEEMGLSLAQSGRKRRAEEEEREARTASKRGHPMMPERGDT